jgi:ubiquinone/menaquinone biosynthesis C-methylase UbiE
MNRIPEFGNDFPSSMSQAQSYSNAIRTPLIRMFLEHIPDLAGLATAADLCSGEGDYADALSKAYPELVINAYDTSADMISIGEAREPKPSVTRFNKDVLTLDGDFDFIYCTYSLHHFEDPLKFWEKVKSLSHVGTKVFVVDLRRPVDETSLENILKATPMEIGDSTFMEDFRNSLKSAYTIEEVQSQLASVGLGYLEVVQCDIHGIEIKGEIH